MTKPFERVLERPQKSFFLLGPRGTGKSTWLNQHSFQLKIDLLQFKERLSLERDPGLLKQIVAPLKKGDWVLIDEVQKIPSLLDEVHSIYEEKQLNFALSGSSARKLKRSSTNLLAGRAINRQMFSLNYKEIHSAGAPIIQFQDALEWGTLPLVLSNFDYKEDTLDTYIHNYLRQELMEEGIIRKLDAFARFLNVAGQMNAQVLNVENIAREAQVPRPSVDKYFEVLVETLIGFYLPAYQPRFKVKESSRPKFYFFDYGVARAAAGLTRQALDSVTLGYALETLILNEVRSYLSYSNKHYPLYYYGLTGGGEIDLVVQLKQKTHSTSDQICLIEIKNSTTWKPEWSRQAKDLRQKKGFKNVVQVIGVYRGSRRMQIDDVDILPVEDFLESLHQGKLW